MAIEHKIVPGTPDEVCVQCSQLWEDECRAYQAPQSDAEYTSRMTGFGAECDTPQVKELRYRREGTKYMTPAGRYDK